VAAQRAAAAALIDGGGPLLSAVEAQARALKCSPLAAVAAQCTMHTVHTLHEEPHARRRRRTHSGALVKSNRPSPQTCSADSSAQRQCSYLEVREQRCRGRMLLHHKLEAAGKG